MKPSILSLALVLSGGLPGGFNIPSEARATDVTDTNGPIWGETVAGFQMAATLDETNGIIHCRIRNATTNEMDYPSFDFGYFEFIRLEFRSGTNWIQLPAPVFPRAAGFSSAVPHMLDRIQPGQVVLKTFTRERFHSWPVLRHDGYLRWYPGNTNLGATAESLNQGLATREALVTKLCGGDTFALDLIRDHVLTNLPDGISVEARVGQKFGTGEITATLYSPVFVLNASAIKSLARQSFQLNGGIPTEPVNVSDINITFAKPPTIPSGELPKEAMYPPGMDPNERGAFTNIVAGHIAALNVTWADSNRFKTEKQTGDFLRELLSNTNTETWTFHVWSYADSEPSIVATIEHTNGKTGQWVIWCSPNVAWAYQDENGKWWWGSWPSWRLPKPKSLGTGREP